MRTQNESDLEKGTDNEEPRKAAGFEVLTADRNEVIILFPTKYYMLGISAVILIVSIVCWILTKIIYEYFVWSVFSMLSIGLIIFLPEYFSNIINFAIHLCYWIAFSLYVFVKILIVIGNKQDTIEKIKAAKPNPAEQKAVIAELETLVSYVLGCSFVILILAILVTLLIFRFLFFYYKNR
ncbi:hypothetical protein GCK72_000843 [Caenorhabditis remanei]|uniref:Uncharacterized protein n=1 Tax=Caenorhabditis remanei TaxID=31234 RepID=E3N4P3_CAERE|nr:hypothetical protein GCK72_000843 [Caenorhabditis remanei]EFO86425.1 hypothetical protein CRE_01225 [Caenorhabditis remanei]KAF1769030.1 hypothetical protein GCK72_000843 [Caenorhabditis remanei]